MRITHTTARVALGCAVAMLSGSAFAITLGGTHVDYRIDSDLGLFGTASVVGDSLVFAPTSFIATGATGWAGEEITVTVFAHENYLLTGFDLSETARYTGYTPGNAWIDGTLRAIDIEGNSGNQETAPIVGSTLDGSAGSWTGGAAISVPAAGWGGGDGKVTSVTLKLANDLYATGAAEIWKTGARIDATAAPVPEAHTYGMLLVGLGVVGFMVRRARMPD